MLADSVDARRRCRTNCRVRTFAAPTQAARGARYVAALAPELLRKPVAVVAHMSPIFALLAAPLARPLRVPLLLWFTQQAAGPSLQAAVRVVDRVLTVDERTLPFALAEGARDRARHRRRRAAVRRGAAGRRCGACSVSAATRRSRAGRPRCARWPSCRTRRSSLHGPLADGRRARGAAAARGARRRARRAERVTFGREVPYAGRCRTLFGLADARRERDARQRGGQGRATRRPPRACRVFAASPVFDDAAAGRASLPRRLSELARRADPRLRAAAPGASCARASRSEHSVEHWADRVLEEAGRVKPRVLFVSRERFRLPLDGAQKRKWDAVAGVVEHRVLAAARRGLPDARRALSPRRARSRRACSTARSSISCCRCASRASCATSARRRRSCRASTSTSRSCSRARLAARRRRRSILDVQGDWHEATRLYGSPLRRLLNPVNDAFAPLAVRGADAVRTVSTQTTGLVRALGVEPAAIFPSYVDAEAFLEQPPVPLPARPARRLRRRARALQGLRHARRRVAAAPRRACRTRRSTSSATGRCATAPKRSSPSCRRRPSGRRGSTAEEVVGGDGRVVARLPAVALGGPAAGRARGRLPRPRDRRRQPRRHPRRRLATT